MNGGRGKTGLPVSVSRDGGRGGSHGELMRACVCTWNVLDDKVFLGMIRILDCL